MQQHEKPHLDRALKALTLRRKRGDPIVDINLSDESTSSGIAQKQINIAVDLVIN